LELFFVFAPPPPVRERPTNQWISDSTWVLVDHRAALRRAGKLNQCGSRVIGRQIKAALAKDCKQRAANVEDKIKGLLSAGELKEAWQCLKGWYSMVEDHAPKACHETLVHQTEERIALYSKVRPPGWNIPINVQPFNIPDGIPRNSEIRGVVSGLQNGQAAGAMGLQAEHIKVWLQDVEMEEECAAHAGRGDK
jgi:hypothetical protein